MLKAIGEANTATELYSLIMFFSHSVAPKPKVFAGSAAGSPELRQRVRPTGTPPCLRLRTPVNENSNQLTSPSSRVAGDDDRVRNKHDKGSSNTPRLNEEPDALKQRHSFELKLNCSADAATGPWSPCSPTPGLSEGGGDERILYSSDDDYDAEWDDDDGTATGTGTQDNSRSDIVSVLWNIHIYFQDLE